jgi:large subunit ribosomal protein L1
MKKVQHSTSKRFKEVISKVDPKKVYSLEEAIKLAKETSTVKFDASVELHIKLGINPKKSDQQVRSSVSLPHGTGKDVNIAAVTDDEAQMKAAKAAGASIVGGVDVIEDIKKGKMDFDILVATPMAMKLLAPVAKILGPRGLMPNPKDGTVTPNLAEAVTSLKKGKVNFKNDDSGNLHVMIGKVSFDESQLVENFSALMSHIIKIKPTSAKGTYIQSAIMSTSMGPGIKVTSKK